MRLTKTHSGNWSKQVSSKQSKSLGTFISEEQAWDAHGVDRVDTIKANDKLATRHMVEVGSTIYVAIRYTKTIRRQVHASLEECQQAGVVPGPCNV